MEIAYRIELADIESFYRHHFDTSPSLKRSYEKGYALETIGFIALYILFSNKQDPENIIAWAGGLIACLSFYRFSIHRNIKASIERFEKEGHNKGILGMHRLTLNEYEIVEISSVGESRSLWTGVERISRNKDYIFIYISAISAYIIPNRAFKGNEETESFYNSINAYYKRINY